MGNDRRNDVNFVPQVKIVVSRPDGGTRAPGHLVAGGLVPGVRVAERRRGGELGKRRRKLVRDWVREGDKAVVAGGGEWVGRYELKEGGVGAFGPKGGCR